MPNEINNLNLSPFAKEIFNDAHQIATLMRHEFIMPEHFMMAAASLCNFSNESNRFGNKFEKIADDINELLNSNIPQCEDEIEPTLSSLMKKALKSARKIIQQSGDVPIPAVAIVIAIMNTKECICNSVIAQHISDSEIADILSFIMTIDGKSLRGYDLEDNDDFVASSNKSANDWMKYITDLNPLRGDASKAIVGRKKEMARLAQALCRCDKNNALIVGEAGVGKSAIVKGFVVQLDTYPSKISQLPVYELSVASILANAQYQGDIEQRIASTMNGIKQLGGGIIVIDDIHTLAGSKGDANGSRDLTATFLPYLDDDALRFIGITTFEDVTRHLDGHNRFLRRFRRIDIEEPSQQEAIEILNGVKRRFEKYHDIRIAPG